MADHYRSTSAGLALAREYFVAVVRPLLDRWCAGVDVAAARVGTGSEVLGLDDTMSQDHDWGLRLQLFVAQADLAAVRSALREHLPHTFRGYPSRIRYSGSVDSVLGIDVVTVADFACERLGFDPRWAATCSDWLSLSGQAALEVVSGQVFLDEPGELSELRACLAWYPDDIWRYVIACDWQRIDQALPSIGRAGHRGDRLGASTITARVVDCAIHLAFTLARQWMPYPKWRGTVFRSLPLAAHIADSLQNSLTTSDEAERCRALRAALVQLASQQSDLGLPSTKAVVVPFWDRPYMHIEPTLVPAILGSITDPVVRALPAGIGCIEQRTDNVDILTHAGRRRAMIHSL